MFKKYVRKSCKILSKKMWERQKFVFCYISQFAGLASVSLMDIFLQLFRKNHRGIIPESIDLFIEDQTFLRLYDPAQCQPLSFPPASCLSFSVFLWVIGWATAGRGQKRSLVVRPQESLVLNFHLILSRMYRLWLLKEKSIESHPPRPSNCEI